MVDHFEENLIKFCVDVYQTLGTGYKEQVYQRALSYDLSANGFIHSTEVNVNIHYKNVFIGFERADIVVNNPQRVIELKAQNSKISHKELFQLHRYLLDLGYQSGYVINFSHVNYCIDQNTILKALEIYKVENSPDRTCKAFIFNGSQFVQVS